MPDAERFHPGSFVDKAGGLVLLRLHGWAGFGSRRWCIGSGWWWHAASQRGCFWPVAYFSKLCLVLVGHFAQSLGSSLVGRKGG